MALGLDTAVGVGVGVAALAGARIPAMLRCLTPPAIGVVPFAFNPDKLSMTRRAKQARKNTSRDKGTTQPVTQTVTGSTIGIGKVYLEGMTTKILCDTLLTWMSPGSGGLIEMAAAALMGSNLEYEPPDLTFQWGPPMIGFMYTVKLTSCKIDYTRFTSEGIPIRAEVNLTMEEKPSLLGSLPMNPTSGGLPGRRAHTVGEGESLQSIATANYGQPGLWRRIAEVNGITDPARVRAGATVYLPNPDELTAGSGR